MQEPKLLVSVVIPTYNRGGLLARAIDSVFAQTWQNLEIVVVDDHSDDNTDSILASFGSSRLKILKVHSHGCIATSRNLGVKAARGQWIAFLDSDDWWSKDKLFRCSEFFNKADFIYHKLKVVSESSPFFLPHYVGGGLIKRPLFLNLLKHGNPIATSSVMVRRSTFDMIGGFDERLELIAAEDYDAWIRISRISERFIFIPASLGWYRLALQSASRKDMSVPMRAVFASYLRDITPENQALVDANAAYAAGRYAYQANRLGVALMELLKSFLHGRLELKIRSLILLVGLPGKYLLSLATRFLDK